MFKKLNNRVDNLLLSEGTLKEVLLFLFYSFIAVLVSCSIIYSLYYFVSVDLAIFSIVPSALFSLNIVFKYICDFKESLNIN